MRPQAEGNTQDRGHSYGPIRPDIAAIQQENSTEINSINTKLYGERNTGLRAITALTSKQTNKQTITTLKNVFEFTSFLGI